MNPRPNQFSGGKGLPGRRESRAGDISVSVPTASVLSTLTLLAGLLATMTTIRGDAPAEIAAYVARGFGVSLALSVMIDLRNGIRNLIRADVMALFALYFLTFFEFLLPQNNFNSMISPSSLYGACYACAIGFAGMAIGRHLPAFMPFRFSEVFEKPVTPSFLMKLFWFCFVGGYFYMMMTVNFDPVQLVSEMTDVRFAQSWSRGKFGDWRALLGEMALLIYVIPAIAGVIFARSRNYTKWQLFQVSCIFLFTLFYGFSGGTRNIFASFVVTFLIGYAFALPGHQTIRILLVSGVAAVLLLLATRYMLEFRSIGLKYYLAGAGQEEGQDAVPTEKEFFVDYNLYVICRLVDVFPKRYPYLGWEIPYQSIIRPIPRALWPGKPEGLSTSLEDAVGVEGMTLASSFVGEAYISFGNLGVFCIALFFGAVFGWWGCLASPRNSEFGILIYASGFFAAVISMRSMFVFTTAMLPTVAAIVFGQYWMDRKKKASGSVSGSRKGVRP